MSQFGPFNFEITSESAKPKTGQLSLTYTIDQYGAISGASVTYTAPNGNSQSFNVTFTGTSAPYPGTLTDQPLQNAWNVPQQGAYKYGSFSFSPPTTTPPTNGTFTGTISKDPLAGDVDTIGWEADPSTA